MPTVFGSDPPEGNDTDAVWETWRKWERKARGGGERRVGVVRDKKNNRYDVRMVLQDTTWKADRKGLQASTEWIHLSA